MRDERGADLVEFALVTILLMMIVFGIASFGYALYAYHYVGTAARDATRWAAVNGYTCTDDSSCAAPAGAADIQNYVLARVPMGLSSSDVFVVSSWPVTAQSPAICSAAVNGLGPFNDYPGCTVEVQVSYALSLPFPLVHAPIRLSASSEMVIAH